ncbi:nucleotidyltransferase [Rhizobacter sp. LjRoot28]|uniref:nucleotidyltransferase n=1 Tax=Rhizobacter sp. LjRoot28 TaxID=3342309 RepID=UPI003F507308
MKQVAGVRLTRRGQHGTGILFLAGAARQLARFEKNGESSVTADDYLFSILARENVDTSATSPVWRARDVLIPVLRQWGGQYLQGVNPSGSFAKGTANRSGTDIDLFLSLSPDTRETLKDIYESLFNALKNLGHNPRRQNVSIGLRIGGADVDLVPGKQQTFLTLDHSLYRRKADTWTKTNVRTHVDHVLSHNRLMESRILKLWRTQNGLNCPSFCLELAVIEALKNTSGSGLSSRIWAVLQYLASDFATSRFVDPANGSNVISDDLTPGEKAAIKSTAQRTLQAKTWAEIVK